MDRLQLARHHGIILLVGGVVFFTNLGVPRLWDRDEPRNAGCAAEMLARGDWGVPVFNGQLRSAKPALLYWLIMASYLVVGVNEWGARLPSALLAVGTVLATYHLGRRLFNPQAAIWSAVALATSLLFDVSARAATPDAALIFFSTLGIMFFVRGTFPIALGTDSATTENASDQVRWGFARQTLSWRVTLPLYGTLGLGVLAKGPVGFVLPVAVIGLFILIARVPLGSEINSRTTWWGIARRILRGVAIRLAPPNLWSATWQLRPLLGSAVVLAVALPWYAWVGVQTQGAWLQGFLWDDNVRRVIESLEQHRGSVFYYPAAMLVGMFPWSVFVLPVFMEMVARLARRDSRAASYLFCACWVGVYVGLFTLARTKLPSYIAPCFPALALLAGAFFERWVAGSLAVARWWPQAALGVLLAFSGVLLIALPMAARKLLPGDEWLACVALIPLIGVLAALAFAWQSNPQRAAISFALMAVMLQGTVFGVAVVRVDRHKQYHVLFEKARELTPEPRLAALDCLESSWVVYARRPIEQFHLDGFPVSPAPPAWPPISAANRSKSLAEFLAKEGSFVITTERGLEYMRTFRLVDMDKLQVVTQVPYFLSRRKVLLVGRKLNAAEPAQPAEIDTEESNPAIFSAGL